MRPVGEGFVKDCIVCAEPYVTDRFSSKFCSPRCCKKDWKQRHREEVLAQGRVYAKKKYAERIKDRVLLPKNCAYCGTSFVPHVRVPGGKFCRRRCAEKSWKENNPEKVAEMKRQDRQKHRERYAKEALEYHDKTRFGGNRKKALERDNYKCTRCESKDNLIVHHHDRLGLSENVKPEDRNNDLDNLITLCRACHAKEHHTGRKNVKKLLTE